VLSLSILSEIIKPVIGSQIKGITHHGVRESTSIQSLSNKRGDSGEDLINMEDLKVSFFIILSKDIKYIQY
jgi:hypothetical protein